MMSHYDWKTKTKIAIFPTPHLYLFNASTEGFPRNFVTAVRLKITKVMGKVCHHKHTLRHNITMRWSDGQTEMVKQYRAVHATHAEAR